MSQKLAIITGASKGIGRATACLFLERGYRVINLSRTENSEVENRFIDLSDANSVTEVVSTLQYDVSQASQTVLVHNAAQLIKDSATDMSAQRFADVFQTNVTAPAQINALLIPSMKPNSSIVFVGSTLSRKAVANSASYVSSKHGLLGLMRATCQDLKGRDIHSAMVMPGFTDTEMLREHVGQDETILDALAQGVLLGRLAKPIEIASVVIQIAENPVLNGAEIDANLGQIEH